MNIPPNEIIVVDVKMPFWSMVTFMVKWALAAIPALVLLILLGFFISALFAIAGRTTFSSLTRPSSTPIPTPAPTPYTFAPMPTPVPRSYP